MQTEKDEPDFSKYPRTYQKYIKREETFVAKFVKPSDRILDVGCGVGRFIPLLAPIVSSYVGIDKDRAYIRRAQTLATHYNNVKVMVLDAHKISKKFKPMTFDKAIATWNTIGCVSNDRKALVELSIVVSKSIFFSVVSKGSLERRIKYYKQLGIRHTADKETETIFSKAWGAVKAYSRQDIQDICGSIPFKINEIKSVMGLGYFVVMNRLS